MGSFLGLDDGLNGPDDLARTMQRLERKQKNLGKFMELVASNAQSDMERVDKYNPFICNLNPV